MTEEHTPRIYIGGGEAWVRCNCGWKSDNCAGTSDASFQWAEHISEVVRRQKEAADA